jgi:transcriptional regulator with XRE-family HTH domain
MYRNEILLIFGKTIRKIRLELGISQEDLALKSGLDRSYLGGVERGERNPSLVNICKISSALGISPSSLLSDLDKTNTND